MARPLHLPLSNVIIVRDSYNITSIQKIPVPAGFLFQIPANSGSDWNCILWFRCIPSGDYSPIGKNVLVYFDVTTNLLNPHKLNSWLFFDLFTLCLFLFTLNKIEIKIWPKIRRVKHSIQLFLLLPIIP